MRTLLFALTVAVGLEGQPAKSKLTEVDRIFAAFNTHTPGCAVGVSEHGTVALRAGYGMADLERGVPVNADTVFESGSVAKQFTAMAILLLAQQGKISLDDPMRKYLPELPDYGASLTIRQVLSHVSGLREWRLMATFSGTPEGTYVLDNHDLLRIASRQRALNFDPGTAYSYTNTGFNIATILDKDDLKAYLELLAVIIANRFGAPPKSLWCMDLRTGQDFKWRSSTRIRARC